VFPNAHLQAQGERCPPSRVAHQRRKLVFNGHTHEQFVDLFHAIGEDRDNRVVILTGGGDAFMDTIEPEGFDFFSPQGYDKILREGRKVLMNILDIDAHDRGLNGPVLLHSEYALLTISLSRLRKRCSRTSPHSIRHRSRRRRQPLVAEAIGSIRGRYFILTRQKLDAQTPKIGACQRNRARRAAAHPRARDRRSDRGAAAAHRPLHAHRAGPRSCAEIIDEGVGYSLALEGISAADIARRMAAKN